jgi:hypothetical protein
VEPGDRLVKGRLGALLAGLTLLAVGVLLGSALAGWGDRRRAGDSADQASVPYDISVGDQERRISVEVLNGAGDAGAASEVTERLRSLGFDVKTYGNAGRFDYPSTLVLDRSGRAGAARDVARALGGVELRSEPDSTLYLDATVILGKDWRRLFTPDAR